MDQEENQKDSHRKPSAQNYPSPISKIQIGMARLLQMSHVRRAGKILVTTLPILPSHVTSEGRVRANARNNRAIPAHRSAASVAKIKKTKVNLGDGKERSIQQMMSTTFWHPDGTPMSSQQFQEQLFGRLPDFFASEDELRAIWSIPETRRRLLEGLAATGFGAEQGAEMQKIIDAVDSDLFDLLAHVAYSKTPLTREVRAAQAKVYINSHFNSKQQAFLDFVLQHYVAEGVEELEQSKLNPLLRLKYHDFIADAVADLSGKPEEIKAVFAGFQKYFYEEAVD